MAKRGDFVLIEQEHVAVFVDSSIGRQVTRSILCGVAWNVTRDGLVKTIRVKGGYIRELKDITGLKMTHTVDASKVDVPAALLAAEGKGTVDAAREAIRPLLARKSL